MAMSPAVLAYLAELTGSLGLDDQMIQESLASLISALADTIESSCGLQLRITDHGWPVTLTEFSRSDLEPVTSLSVVLASTDRHSGREGRITFYATTPGAFVDLGADLTYALDLLSGPPGQPAGVQVRDARRDGVELDAELPPSTRLSGLYGLAELSTINRAVGLLIGRGHQVRDAHRLIRDGAAAEKTEAHLFAARLLGR